MAMSYSSGSSTRNGYINTQTWPARPVFVPEHPNKVVEMQQIMQAAGLSLEGQTLQFSNDRGNPHDVASARAAEIVGVTWPNIPLAQPLGDNNGSTSVICNEPLSFGHPAYPRLFNPVGASNGPEVIALGVSILTPKLANGRFPYRVHVTARITHTLNGTSPHAFSGVVLGPATANASQLVLVCYAVCRSCTSQAPSQYQQCKPTRFYLDPVPTKRNQGFDLDGLSGTLTGDVTFKIKSRRKRPRSEDQEWRCRSETLILTYCLHDHIGNLVAKKEVENPFQARPHTKKGCLQRKPRRSEWVATPGGISSMPSLQGARGIPSVSFTSGPQIAPPGLPPFIFAFGF